MIVNPCCAWQEHWLVLSGAFKWIRRWGDYFLIVQWLLLLLLLKVPPVASVGAFDCSTHPKPMQMVKTSGVYKLKELDISTGVYSDIHTVILDTAVDAGGVNPGEVVSRARAA